MEIRDKSAVGKIPSCSLSLDRNDSVASTLSVRMRLARWFGHQQWIPRGHVLLVTMLCPPETAPDYSFNVGFYGLRYVGNLRSLLDWSVFFFGAHAKSELKFMAVAAQCLRAVSRGVVYVDVGANVGQHLLFMSMHSDNAYGFEPWAPVFERARSLLALNAVTNVQLFPIALGEISEKRRYFPPSTFNHGSGSFVEDWFGLNDSEGAPVFLEVQKGDAFFKSSNIRDVGILKIDVEGSEASVCRGLRESIIRDRPFILMEVSGQSAREFGSESNLRSCFYDGALFFRLRGGRHRASLIPYSLNESLRNDKPELAEVVIIPPEHKESCLSRMREDRGRSWSGGRLAI